MPDKTPDPKFPWLIVPEDASQQRLDNYLFAHLKGLSRGAVYGLLRSGEVRVNSKRAKPSDRLTPGALLRVPYHLIQPEKTVSVPTHLTEILKAAILFEDDDLLVINKPPHIAVHGGSGLSFGVIEVVRAGFPQAKKYELVHRLDKETSGCLLIAKNRSCLTTLQDGFRAGKIKKTYWTLLSGQCPKNQTVTAPLKKNILQSGERMVQVDPVLGKPSTTVFQCLRYFPEADLSWVVAKPASGRTHQIRVHAAFMGHSIVCDPKYGDKMRVSKDKAIGLKRLALHAHALSFVYKDIPLTLQAPWLDSEFQPFIESK